MLQVGDLNVPSLNLSNKYWPRSGFTNIS